MNRIALVAVPAPFKVAVTMQATVTTDLSASQSHIAAGTGACGFVDVNGSSQRTIQFATPTPIVLSNRSSWLSVSPSRRRARPPGAVRGGRSSRASEATSS